MIRISKSEAMWLQDKGFRFKEHIFKTYTAHPTYYCGETSRVLNALNDYRNSKIVGGRP